MANMLPLPHARRVAVIASNRIPFTRSNKHYAKHSAQDLLTAALSGLVDRAGLAGEPVGVVVGGAVMKHTRNFNLVREAVLGTRLSATTPCVDTQLACATGIEAAHNVATRIALGEIDSGIACGVDSASDAPIVVSETLRKALIRANGAKTLSQKLKIFAGLRPQHLAPVPPRNNEPRTGKNMGEHAARTAAEWHITRQAQDQLAAASHQRLAAAYERGDLADLVTAFAGLDRDAILRPDTTVEKLANLKPVFGHPDTATMTAGNSTAITDGASSVLLASEDWAKARGVEPLAYLTATEYAAVDFVHGGEGLLMAPAYAVAKLLQRTGLGLSDFDIVEMHEAFASQVLATLAAWESEQFCTERLGLDHALGSIDPDRLNPWGSSLAAGHPFAATGARLIGVLAKQLEQRGSGRGLISVCAAGGQGAVMVLER